MAKGRPTLADIGVTPRSGPLSFHYLTPLSRTTMRGKTKPTAQIEAQGEHIVAFGMVEADLKVTGDWVVLDPQTPTTYEEALRGVTAEHLALVLNAKEARAMSGELDVNTAAAQILHKSGAAVVVTKLGARGALVTTSDYQTEIGPHPTRRVMPIGTGDVFVASFAWAWMHQGFDPIEAARVGSRATAFWAMNQTVPVPRSVLKDGLGLPAPLIPGESKVYLAGPFFTVADRWLIDLVWGALNELGATVFSPFHDVGVESESIATEDLRGLRSCDTVLALLDAWDPGTLFECGWAASESIPVIAYASELDERHLTMLEGTGADAYSDLSAAVYNSIWRALTRE